MINPIFQALSFLACQISLALKTGQTQHKRMLSFSGNPFFPFTKLANNFVGHIQNQEENDPVSQDITLISKDLYYILISFR